MKDYNRLITSLNHLIFIYILFLKEVQIMHKSIEITKGEMKLEYLSSQGQSSAILHIKTISNGEYPLRT